MPRRCIQLGNPGMVSWAKALKIHKLNFNVIFFIKKNRMAFSSNSDFINLYVSFSNGNTIVVNGKICLQMKISVLLFKGLAQRRGLGSHYKKLFNQVKLLEKEMLAPKVRKSIMSISKKSDNLTLPCSYVNFS